MHYHRRSRHRMRGAVAVEFALVAVPLITLLLGIAEFGHAFYQYNTVVKSVRDATRLLSAYDPTDTADYPLAQAQCLAVYGTTDCSGSPLVGGLTTKMVVVCDQVNTAGCTGAFKNVPTNPAAETINLVQVKVTGYPYTQITGFFNLGKLTFGDISCVMRQVL
ncbi:MULTISPECIES: TadE/TadG family type IV pilus assembly protein [unclassified Paraburkholderia]|uniref:TadE/TadG family type IV pilus assembly protein n=1 Tax=unclassified Paraburkholderia TaxID=2615204 RepID=UPI001622BEEC|nr:MULTISPECIES: TadE/TadG family type IV pilus assembly protein [unclassified Paraburkholderia]MBB5448163.1 Flp pilus assembly protein TadG [Paraburkholderia sp. WSM4177]MBB5488567.1 Flp pilus assembly protein TadG [Paraburkholderia sp. WSM4180]